MKRLLMEKNYGRNAWDYGLFHHHHHNHHHHHHHQTTKSWIVDYFFIFLVSFGRHDFPCFQKKPGQPKYKPLSKGPMVILAFMYLVFVDDISYQQKVATNSHPLRQVSLSNWEKRIPEASLTSFVGITPHQGARWAAAGGGREEKS